MAKAEPLIVVNDREPDPGHAGEGTGDIFERNPLLVDILRKQSALLG